MWVDSRFGTNTPSNANEISGIRPLSDGVADFFEEARRRKGRGAFDVRKEEEELAFFTF